MLTFYFSIINMVEFEKADLLARKICPEQAVQVCALLGRLGFSMQS